MQKAAKRKTALLSMIVVLRSCVGIGFAGETPPVRVSAEISNITYQSNDEYRVEIRAANVSSEALVLNRLEPHFFVQSELLGQWIELSGRTADSRMSGGGIAVPGDGKWMTAEIVTIPRALPHLFKNHEGDVNVLFRYTFTFTVAASQEQGKGVGESAYWLTPGTGR